MNIQNVLEPIQVLQEEVLFERAMDQIDRMYIPSIEEVINSREIMPIFELFYELEYKYNTIRVNGFKGVPERRKRILSILEQKSKEVINVLTHTFIKVIGDWLESHAITDPNTWAKKRLENVDPDDMLGMICMEYSQYSFAPHASVTSSKAFEKMIKDMFDHRKKTTYFSEYLDIIKEDIKYYEIEKLEQYGEIEEYNNDWGTSYTSMEDAKKYLESQDEIDYYDFIDSGMSDEDTFIQSLDGIYGKPELVYQEMYSILVFPKWFKKWAKKGLVQTRERVQRAYDTLLEINTLPVSNQFAELNIAINISHQNGPMIDYYEEHYMIDRHDLKNLTTRGVDDWEQELKEMGVTFNMGASTFDNIR